MQSITAFFLILVTLAISTVVSAEGLNKEQYEELYTQYNMQSEFGKAVNQCLQGWGSSHPFKDRSKVRFRVISGNVKVFGVGDNVSDTARTSYPQLILVRPAVNVMGAMKYELLNPNGWYCMKGNVNVMGRSVIDLACNTKLASTNGTVNILGKTQGQGESGTTVMGKTTINRLCDRSI